MADRSNVELLIEYVRVQNDDWRREVHREGGEKYKQTQEMVAMLQRALQSAEQELQQLKMFAPREVIPDPTRGQTQPREPMPKVVTKGPLPEHLRPKVATAE